MLKNMIYLMVFVTGVFSQNLQFNLDVSGGEPISGSHNVKIVNSEISEWNNLGFLVEDPFDFQQNYTIIIDKDKHSYNVKVGNQWYNANKFRVDMNNDGIWEQDWTYANVITVSYDYPDPPNGLLINREIRIEVEYSNLNGQTIEEEGHADIRVYADPVVYNNDNSDFFVQFHDNGPSNKKPVLMVEGFDPLNTNFPNMYYNLSYDLVNTTLNPDEYAVFLLNFSDGGADMRDNADVLMSSLQKVNELCPNYPINLTGLSMGGVISRYALARAEEQGIDHHVGIFVSYDSPQQGANFNYQLQTLISASDRPEVADLQTLFGSMAAKQLLFQNAFDTIEPNHHGIEYNSFYSEINALNGDGYPHNCYNVGVSNGSLDASYDLSMKDSSLFTVHAETFINDTETTISILPSVIDIEPGALYELSHSYYANYDMGINLGSYEFDIHFDPVFIPTRSSLDLVGVEYDENYNITYTSSPFDEIILQDGSHYHPEVTASTAAQLLEIFENGTVDVKVSNIINGEDVSNSRFSVVGGQTGLVSGSFVPLANNQYSTITPDHQMFMDTEKQHYSWKPDDLYDEAVTYSLKNEILVYHSMQDQEAYFELYNTVSIVSEWNVDFHDPWYVENIDEPGVDPVDWIQPNEFRPLSEMTGDGSYQVFLDQNEYFDDDLPIYRLRAPMVIDQGGGEYEVFSHWSGNHVSFQHADQHETAVVFTNTGANPTAIYNHLTVVGEASVWSSGNSVYLQSTATIFEDGTFKNLQFSLSNDVNLTSQSNPVGYRKYLVNVSGAGSITLSYGPLQANDLVDITTNLSTIPAGTRFDMPSNSTIRVYDVSKLAGTEEQRVIFQGEDGVIWKGLQLAQVPNNDVFEHVVIKNVETAIQPMNGVTFISINDISVEDANYGFAPGDPFYDLLGGHVYIRNSVFRNIQTAGVYCNTNNSHFADVWEISNCQFEIPGNDQAIAIQFAPPSDGGIHQEFSSIRIVDNQINGFISGIEIVLNGIIAYPQLGSHLDWEDDLLRVVLERNRIEHCEDYGVRIHGQHALYAHHNVIANCGDGYNLYRITDGVSHSGTEESHRILNETLVGNTNGIFADQADFHWGSSGKIMASILYGNSQDYDLNNTALLQGSNLTNTDPLFINYVSGNYNLTSNSPAVDAGLEDFDGDGTNWETDEDDQDPDGSRMDMGAYYLHQLSGAIVEDLTIDGSAVIQNTTIINSGATLTIVPGSIIKVNQYKRLEVYGTLIAEGTVSDPVEFSANAENPADRYWNGIYVYSGGEAYLDHVNVRKAYYGIRYYYGAGSVTNSLFEHGRFGLWSYHATLPTVSNNVFQYQEYAAYLGVPNTSVSFTNNTITETTYGLEYNGANGMISNNLFSNNTKDGIRFSNLAQGNLTTIRMASDPDPAKNNRFINNSRDGFRVWGDAAPLIGNFVNLGNKYIGGYNEFTSNTTNGVNSTSSIINARVNWSGGVWDGSFSRYPNVDMLHGGGLKKTSSDEEPSGNVLALFRAQGFQLDSAWVDAITLYDSLITAIPEDSLALYALIGLNFCYEEVEGNVLEMYLENLQQVYPECIIGREAQDLLVTKYAAEREFGQALDHSAPLIDEYELLSDSDEDLAFALFERQMILNDLAGENSLGKAAKQAESIRIRVVNKLTKTSAAKLVMAMYDMQPEPIAIPATFALLPNYPNPFNPSTTIQYELPKTADVNITIYDILGRNVWSFEESTKAAGHYSFQWKGLNDNGKQVASGIYLISFSTPEFRAVQKAVLIR